MNKCPVCGKAFDLMECFASEKNTDNEIILVCSNEECPTWLRIEFEGDLGDIIQVLTTYGISRMDYNYRLILEMK